MKEFASAREKWSIYLSGQDTGPMVSPLCDDWSLDIPYYWPYDEPEPAQKGHNARMLKEQLAMAKVCGYDPTFYYEADFIPMNPDLVPKHESENIDGLRRETVIITTPYGDLTSTSEQKTTMRTVKSYIETREDFVKSIWYTKQCMDFDEGYALGQCVEARKAAGDKGMLGTWVNSPFFNLENHEDIFYHLEDWPDLVQELYDVSYKLKMKKVDIYRRAGFDYLFYCVSGTEYSSPEFFRRWTMDETKALFKDWRDSGRFILWHSCGHIKRLVELGYYNELKPDIFETVSEPPVGNLPSLKWARERIDKGIITKGNIPLGIMLNGTEEEVRKDVWRIRGETKGYRHVMGLSDDILHNTPLANVLALVEEARRENG